MRARRAAVEASLALALALQVRARVRVRVRIRVSAGVRVRVRVRVRARNRVTGLPSPNTFALQTTPALKRGVPVHQLRPASAPPPPTAGLPGLPLAGGGHAGRGETQSRLEQLLADYHPLEPFVAAASFGGLKTGYVFKTGAQGVGYYAEPRKDMSRAGNTLALTLTLTLTPTP